MDEQIPPDIDIGRQIDLRRVLENEQQAKIHLKPAPRTPEKAPLGLSGIPAGSRLTPKGKMKVRPVRPRWGRDKSRFHKQ